MSLEATEARDFFAIQRREAAWSVRTAVQMWEQQRRKDHKADFARAMHNHTVVINSRKAASHSRQHVQDIKKDDARPIRQATKEAAGHRRTLVLATAATNRANAQERYNSRFVVDKIAEAVAATDYGAPALLLSNSEAHLKMSTVSLGSSPDAAAVKI